METEWRSSQLTHTCEPHPGRPAVTLSWRSPSPGLSFPIRERRKTRAHSFFIPQDQFGIGPSPGDGVRPGVGCPYLSGLARRQVQKHNKPRASMNRRKLPVAVSTMSRVGDNRTILRGRESLVVAVTGAC